MHSFDLHACDYDDGASRPTPKPPSYRKELKAKCIGPGVGQEFLCVDSRGNCFIRCVWRQEALE
ncbi:hypothetical protein HYDPIDRAFT_117065 [Hydnomerulius pinastri MD-312]|uniref:Uncharacterized protein n=1 Tax=Hydnomerulius pinastri MD-312 TaxID=994086 RepID=A0A0C9WAJ6_9AGAM|nr:hypothetical protein HYDPIDRAFT_117065 [Hydnomerulius pinastri MD-312]